MCEYHKRKSYFNNTNFSKMVEENHGSEELGKLDIDEKVKKNYFSDVNADETSTPRSGKQKVKIYEHHKAHGPYVIPQKIKKMAPHFGLKNPVQQLNELQPGLEYIVQSDKRSSCNSEFEVSVHVNGQDFVGRGHSKQKAKYAAAQAALSSFGFDVTETINVIDKKSGFKEEILITSGAVAMKADPVKIINEAHKKNPVLLLNELHPGLNYILVEENPENLSQRFRVSVEINGIIYEGTGQRKKHAKASAARAVLHALYNECYSIYVNCLIAQSDDDGDSDDEEDLYALSQELADKMHV